MCHRAEGSIESRQRLRGPYELKALKFFYAKTHCQTESTCRNDTHFERTKHKFQVFKHLQQIVSYFVIFNTHHIKKNKKNIGVMFLAQVIKPLDVRKQQGRSCNSE